MNAFRSQLWHALWEGGLLPVPDLHRRCCEELSRQGVAEQARLAEYLGTETWTRLMEAWSRPRPTALAAHQLGTGRMVTEFLIAPLNLADDERAAVVRLGAWASLIVALYDDLLDDGGAGSASPSQAGLRCVLRDREAAAMTEGTDPLGGHAVVPLVALYFQHLSVLPEADARPQIRRCLHRAIMTMYEAEWQTVQGDRPMKMKIATRRKSALPHVVMGLPAWLVSPAFCPTRYLRHLRWLYAFGEFCGWIDDALDLAEDARTGHPNCVRQWLDAAGPEGAPAVAGRIVARGQRVLAQWQADTPDAAALSPFITEAMTTCLGLGFASAVLSDV